MISDYMDHQITVENRSSISASGVPSYGSATTHEVFFRRKSRRLTGNDGNVLISDAFFYALPSVVVAEGDRVVSRGSRYEVVMIDHYDEPEEDIYQRVSLQRRS